MLLLTRDDVELAIAGRDAVMETIGVTERALAGVADDDAPRSPSPYPWLDAGERIIPLLGALRSHGLLGGRVSTIGIPTASGAGGRGYKMLFDLATLHLVALIEDVGVHPLLVGAHVGVATKWLARETAASVGLIGSGSLAMACLTAVCAVRPVDRAAAYSPNAAHREQFATRASDLLGIDVRPSPTASAAVAEADIVNCATNNYFRGGTSVFAVDWLPAGVHVNTIGRCEAPPDCVDAMAVFPPTMADFRAIFPPWDPPLPATTDGAGQDLASVVAGKHPGRTSQDERTLYLGPSIAAEHIAIAAWVHDLARRLGIGTEWPAPALTQEETG